METKYPEVNVQLIGQDGNAFYILAKVCGALRSSGVPREIIDQFIDDATSGDYENLLRTCMEWVEVS